MTAFARGEPIDRLGPDNVIDMAEAKWAVGNRICLEGNVRPVDTLMKGSREQILQEAKGCIRKTYEPLTKVPQGDRGRDNALDCVAPPSEPGLRISRTRLSG